MAYTKATGVHKIHSTFSASGGVFTFYRDNASTQFAFGEDGTGLDVKFFGDTSGQYALWDESADTFVFNCTLTASGALTFSGSVDLTGANFHVTSASTQIGNASTDKIGFFGVAPAVQVAKVVSTGTASAMAIAILNALETYGLLSATA